MRILQLIPVFSPRFGGPVSVVRSISKELAKRHDVTVYTTTAIDQRHDFIDSPLKVENDGYQIVYFPRILRFTGFNISPSMEKDIKETIRDYDVVHMHSWRHFQDLITYRHAKKHNVPYVLQVHGSLARITAKNKLKWFYDTLFGYKILENASKIVALSCFEAEQYRRMGVPDEKIVIVPNGIDLSEYANLPPKGLFKRKYGITEDKKVILYLGRIHRTKGINFLVKAYAHLTKKIGYKDAVLFIAGPDDGYLKEAKFLAESMGVSNSVLFTGFISKEDKLKALVDAEVFVTPSFYGFPITFLEACAVGAPIVTATLGDRLGWIDGNVGFATPPTSHDLAKAIYTMISDNDLRAKLSENCIKIVKSEFAIEKVVSSLERVYTEALRNFFA